MVDVILYQRGHPVPIRTVYGVGTDNKKAPLLPREWERYNRSNPHIKATGVGRTFLSTGFQLFSTNRARTHQHGQVPDTAQNDSDNIYIFCSKLFQFLSYPHPFAYIFLATMH